MITRVLVTGANGFLASHLIPALLDRGDIFICGTYRRAINRLIQKPPHNLAYEQCDLSDVPGVEGLFRKYRFDAIVHTAGSISTRNDYDYLQESIRDNMASQENLVNEALKHGCKLYIFCSSISSYGDSAQRKDGFREDDIPQPRDVYGWSKYTSEELLRIKTKNQDTMNSIVLRLAGIHGPSRQNGAVYNIARSAVSEEEIVINEPKSLFRFLFVDDAAQAIILALFNRPAAHHVCYNVAGEEIVSLGELAQEIFEISGRSGRITYNKGGKMRNQVMNIDKIKKELKFKPKTLKENLKSMIIGLKNEKAYAFGRTRHE